MEINEKLKFLNPSVKNHLSKLMKEIEENIGYLYELATIDEKTGVYNNKFFSTVSEMEFDKAKRGLGKLSILMIDLDNFKKLNDTYGHYTGDEVLARLGKILKINTRKYDIISRFGGEEFVLLLPNTGANRAKIVCNRIRSKVEKDLLMKKYHMTISGGLTSYRERDTLKRMKERADKAVYKAKRSGKNKIVVI
jgi:diguanylate cyclase (GGDEF)-like protein